MFENRPEKCEICGSKYRISYDHDHKTGKFRGWICHNCNCTIGFCKEDVKRLKGIIDYLNRF